MKATQVSIVLILALVGTLTASRPVEAAPPRIVYSSPPSGSGPHDSWHLNLANLDGSGRSQLPPGIGADVSPDRTELVFNVENEIWRANLDGSRYRKFLGPSPTVETLGRARWSPDGAHLAYIDRTTGTNGPRTSRLVLARANGTGARVLATDVGGSLSWSPDGNRVAVTGSEVVDEEARTGRMFIRTMKLDGSDVRTIHSVDHHRILDLAWSPDGRTIAFVHAPYNGLDDHDIRLVPADGGTARVVPNTTMGVADTVDWSDDGRRLAFYVAAGQEGDTYRYRVLSIRPDGSDRRTHLGETPATRPMFVGNAPGTVPAQAGFDGEVTTTERLDAASPTAAAVAASRRLWSDQHGAVAAEAPEPALPRATYAVLSRIDTFADSLAGAALTFRGPLLYTQTERLPAETRAELERILGTRGLVYVLGGEKAVSPNVVATLQADGYTVRRLAGASRVETALAVADEVRAQFPNYRRVLLARADGPGTAAWADSITGGAFAADARLPLLLSPTDQLHPAVKAWMDRNEPSQTLLLGGPSALSARVERSVPSPVRVHGAARDETATAAARTLWKVEPSGTRRYTVIDGYAADGWAWGLAAAGLADRADAPVLLVAPDTVPTATATAVTGCRHVDLLVVGDTRSVSQVRVDQLDARDTRC